MLATVQINQFLYRMCFSTVTMKGAAFWDEAPCEFIINGRFGGTCHFLLQGRITRATKSVRRLLTDRLKFEKHLGGGGVCSVVIKARPTASEMKV
jgi:hypothetical protein